MNVYQLYEANGNRAGFFVRRQSWSASVALVRQIGGQVDGELQGHPPFFGNPRVAIRFYKYRGVPWGEADVLRGAGAFTFEQVSSEQAAALVGFVPRNGPAVCRGGD